MKNEYDLNKKVDDFIKWYSRNYTKIFDLDRNDKIKTIKNLIDKMAIWYELVYPDDKIYRQIPELQGHFGNDIDAIMFKNNPYIEILFDKNDAVNDLEWHEFYNKDVFMSSLSNEEMNLLSKPKYPAIVFYDYEHSSFHFHLSFDGIIIDDEWKLGQLYGMHIKDAVNLLKEEGYVFNQDNEIIKAIDDYHKKYYQREELLNCVMYRLIEHGGSILGARRAFLFAKEFGLNIDIPMVYGVNYDNPRLRLFINEYIKLGGKKDLLCLENYGNNSNNTTFGILTTVRVIDLIRHIHHNQNSKYTPEENNLHNELIGLLASQVPYEEIERMNELKTKSYNELKKEKKLVK